MKSAIGGRLQPCSAPRRPKFRSSPPRPSPCCAQCEYNGQCEIYTADDLHPRKPKNARSKRVMQARESKEVEDPRTAIFVKGTHPGEKAGGVMKELVRAFKPPLVYAF